MSWLQEEIYDGLERFELIDHPRRVGEGAEVLPTETAVAVLRRMWIDDPTYRLRRALADAGLESSRDASEEELRDHLVNLLESERLALRRVEHPQPRVTHQLPVVDLSDLIEPSDDAPTIQRELTYLDFRLVDDAGQAIAGHAFRVELPDGNVLEGETDETGRFRVRELEAEGEAILWLDP